MTIFLFECTQIKHFRSCVVDEVDCKPQTGLSHTKIKVQLDYRYCILLIKTHSFFHHYWAKIIISYENIMLETTIFQIKKACFHCSCSCSTPWPIGVCCQLASWWKYYTGSILMFYVLCILKVFLSNNLVLFLVIKVKYVLYKLMLTFFL